MFLGFGDYCAMMLLRFSKQTNVSDMILYNLLYVRVEFITTNENIMTAGYLVRKLKLKRKNDLLYMVCLLISANCVLFLQE